VKYDEISVDGHQILIPIEPLDPPTPFAEQALASVQDPDNWKLPTSAFVTQDAQQAREVEDAMDWFLGGHETSTAIVNGVTEYRVSSRGYYHHIGA